MADYKFSQTGSEIQGDLDLVENSIGRADAFSDQTSYNVEDLVIYDNKLWRCKTSYSPGKAWSGTTNWRETTITKELQRSGPVLYGYTITLSNSDVIQIISQSNTTISTINDLKNALALCWMSAVIKSNQKYDLIVSNAFQGTNPTVDLYYISSGSITQYDLTSLTITSSTVSKIVKA